MTQEQTLLAAEKAVIQAEIHHAATQIAALAEEAQKAKAILDGNIGCPGKGDIFTGNLTAIWNHQEAAAYHGVWLAKKQARLQAIDSQLNGL